MKKESFFSYWFDHVVFGGIFPTIPFGECKKVQKIRQRELRLRKTLARNANFYFMKVRFEEAELYFSFMGVLDIDEIVPFFSKMV
jgi:hypothetical protein